MIDWLAPKYVGWLLQGFGVTLALAVAVSAAATALGFGLALARASRNALLARPATAFVALMRNTPLLVQLFFWYFGVAALLPADTVLWLSQPHRWHLVLFDIRWPTLETLAGFIGLTIYTTAFIGEEIRAGLRGVPAGQTHAAAALGLGRFAVFRHVVLPQAVRIALPPLFGQYMNVVKNSSLTMAIGLAELSYASRQVETETFKTFQAFGIATLLYVGAIALIEAVSIATTHRHATAPSR
ncbi:amino acid ABC transporter permease [Pandoraea apista]|uniref:amino acid ABC transporter permease n=1 Tax=Pandoraea apista TaxID=93218 RepID=UPI000659526F|nr:amino acid ABC transporter permease [Pandoraea apista]ALS67243.1 amino acid ABC transporter permease [Pandoraea apista]CFB60609.1 Octopine transport system permease protein OccM [Pandoraea apista]